MTTTNVQPGSTISATEILNVRPSSIIFDFPNNGKNDLRQTWSVRESLDSKDYLNLARAAEELRSSDIPVAFPTETVYGLAADATRSEAVKGIYRAKQRPSDNPLIVHVHSLPQLRQLLRSKDGQAIKYQEDSSSNDTHIQGLFSEHDVIPSIYHSLIEKFWPGPLTLILPNPDPSILAAEVTAGLKTFGARMPSSKLALALIKLTDRPLAAPSANASTRPSPTTAEHVRNDLAGRISTIIDGGSCDVGLESTVVDGLSIPPLVLRPGAITLNDLRSCPGWENVGIGYKNQAQIESQPKAPGMKYRHYSPSASVILYESGSSMPTLEQMIGHLGSRNAPGSIGIIRTKSWPLKFSVTDFNDELSNNQSKLLNDELRKITAIDSILVQKYQAKVAQPIGHIEIWDVALGTELDQIAKGLFAALRELDLKKVDIILVEGLDDQMGDVAAAVMNRLRKAAEKSI